MKIIDQTEIVRNQIRPNIPVKSQNFELFITTPTKQDSGDEYYWQHQDQLQQSSLNFNSQAMDYPKEINQVSIEGSLCTPSTSFTNNSTQYSSINCTQQEMNRSIEPVNTEVVKAANIYLKNNSEQLSIAAQGSATLLNREATSKLSEIKAPQNQIIKSGHFKNHHLFIQGEEAELSLNTQDLNKQEHKELTQLMKLHLKQKGLSLKQLIINGVNND